MLIYLKQCITLSYNVTKIEISFLNHFECASNGALCVVVHKLVQVLIHVPRNVSMLPFMIVAVAEM